MNNEERPGGAHVWGCAGDFLLAAPIGVIVHVSIDLATHPNSLGLFPWAALALSGGALALYLGLQLRDRRPGR